MDIKRRPKAKATSKPEEECTHNEGQAMEFKDTQAMGQAMEIKDTHDVGQAKKVKNQDSGQAYEEGKAASHSEESQKSPYEDTVDATIHSLFMDIFRILGDTDTGINEARNTIGSKKRAASESDTNDRPSKIPKSKNPKPDDLAKESAEELVLRQTKKIELELEQLKRGLEKAKVKKHKTNGRFEIFKVNKDNADGQFEISRVNKEKADEQLEISKVNKDKADEKFETWKVKKDNIDEVLEIIKAMINRAEGQLETREEFLRTSANAKKAFSQEDDDIGQGGNTILRWIEK